VKSILLGITLFLSTTGLAQSAVLVDDFDGVLSVNIPALGSNPVSISAGNIPGAPIVIGGSRGLTFTRTSGSGALQLTIDAGAVDVMQVTAGASDTVTAFFQWDGDTNPNSLDSAGLGGIDLTEGGLNDGFVIAQHANSALAALTMIVYTNTGMGTYTVNTVDTSFIDPFQLIELPFAQFTGSANFANIGAIELFIDGNKAAGLDLSIDFISAQGLDESPVPEPGSLLLLGAALLAAGIRRRRSA